MWFVVSTGLVCETPVEKDLCGTNLFIFRMLMKLAGDIS